MTEEVKSYNQMRDEFLADIRKQCFPLLNNMESRRKKLYSIFKILLPTAGITFVLFILSFVLSPIILNNSFNNMIDNSGFNSFILSFLFSSITPLYLTLTVIILICYAIKVKGFEKDVKKHIIPKLCNALENVNWEQNPEISHDFYLNSQILHSDFSSVVVDDVFTGQYKDVNYNIVEAIYRKEVRSKGSKSSSHQRIFNGLLITLDMNKNFNSHTIIRPEVFELITVKDLKKTTLEDVEFEKKFNVYTNDEVDARYLITPSFMERLNNIKLSFKAPFIECAFYQDKLIIAMDSLPDMFHVGSIWKPLTDESQYFQMFEEILSIIKLIDHFKLDQKIGL